MANSNLSKYMRIIHRYLGFFLAGVMAMYALSGTVLIFRSTDFLKQEKVVERQLDENLQSSMLEEKLRIRGFKIISEDGDIIQFKEGTYNSSTGLAIVKTKGFPFFLDKMTKIHKATTDSPLYWLNIFFGASLLFFVVSSFFMYSLKSTTLKNGLYYAAGGIVLTLIMLFI